MSSTDICARGRHNATAFILSCLQTVFGETPLHGRWLPAEQLNTYIYLKCNVGNDIAFTLPSMMRVINKMLPSVNAEPNTMEIGGTLPLQQIYRSTYQHRTQPNFFRVTTKVGAAPSVPSKKAPTWERDSVLTRLLLQTNSTGVQDVLRHPKRHKGDTDPAHKRGTDGTSDGTKSDLH